MEFVILGDVEIPGESSCSTFSLMVQKFGKDVALLARKRKRAASRMMPQRLAVAFASKLKPHALMVVSFSPRARVTFYLYVVAFLKVAKWKNRNQHLFK